jgi:hypothetical protein
MEPLPSQYAALSRWFPALSQRARALGLSRETLTRWERASSPPRVRPATARAVRSLASVAEDVERLVDDAPGAGAWLLAPQPALRGGSAAALARAADTSSLRTLTELASPTQRVVADRREGLRAQPPATWAAAAPRLRPRDPAEAALLARMGQDEATIGPVA